jgi:hypothetical protein
MRYFYKGVRERGAGNNIWNKRHDVKGSWTKLHNEQLHNLYPSTNTIRMIMPRGLLVVYRRLEGRNASIFRVQQDWLHRATIQKTNRNTQTSNSINQEACERRGIQQASDT